MNLSTVGARKMQKLSKQTDSVLVSQTSALALKKTIVATRQVKSYEVQCIYTIDKKVITRNK